MEIGLVLTMFIQTDQSITGNLINQLLPILEQASNLLNNEYENYISGNQLDIQKKQMNLL